MGVNCAQPNPNSDCGVITHEDPNYADGSQIAGDRALQHRRRHHLPALQQPAQTEDKIEATVPAGAAGACQIQLISPAGVFTAAGTLTVI